VKTLFVILVAWMMGCASIPGRRAATLVASPDRVVRNAAASARPDIQHQTRTSDRHPEAIDLRAAEDRLAISPPHRSTAPAEAALAASTMPGEWTRTQWITLLTDLLSNDKLAHAAAWIGRQPLDVRISRGGLSVALRVATP
jgi:hypothetical protein